MFFNDGRRGVRGERFGMDDESEKDLAGFCNRISADLSLKNFFLRCVVSLFRFARPDFYFRTYRPGTFLTFIVHGGT